jgi:hypothetical protein
MQTELLDPGQKLIPAYELLIYKKICIKLAQPEACATLNYQKVKQ